MQRRWSFHYAIWLLSLIVVFAAPIRGQFASTVIEESFGTWYQWPASEGGNDHWYGVIRVMLETAKGEEFASAWGGHLASFGDAKERDFLSRIVTNRFYTAPYATALVAPAGQTWHWTDGTTFDANLLPSVYANFTNGACCTARMTFTPFGNMQNFPEGVLSAALFEITTRPSELLPYITEVKILNREIWSPGLARFAAPAFGPGALSYQWKVGGVPKEEAKLKELELAERKLELAAEQTRLQKVRLRLQARSMTGRKMIRLDAVNGAPAAEVVGAGEERKEVKAIEGASEKGAHGNERLIGVVARLEEILNRAGPTDEKVLEARGVLGEAQR